MAFVVVIHKDGFCAMGELEIMRKACRLTTVPAIHLYQAACVTRRVNFMSKHHCIGALMSTLFLRLEFFTAQGNPSQLSEEKVFEAGPRFLYVY